MLEVDVLVHAPQRLGLVQRHRRPGLSQGSLSRALLFFTGSSTARSTRSLAPAVVPLRPFLGVMGVARADDGAFRTRPPGPFGGNLDVRELCAGSRLYLPVFNRGALFSCGDGHAAQGDGEVCINGIECPLDVTLRFHLHKQQPLSSPIVEACESIAPDSTADAWVVVETGTDLADAARAATSRMVDLLVSRWGFSEVHAYILCSVGSEAAPQPGSQRAGAHRERRDCKQILPERRLFPSQ